MNFSILYILTLRLSVIKICPKKNVFRLKFCEIFNFEDKLDLFFLLHLFYINQTKINSLVEYWK